MLSVDETEAVSALFSPLLMEDLAAAVLVASFVGLVGSSFLLLLFAALLPPIIPLSDLNNALPVLIDVAEAPEPVEDDDDALTDDEDVAVLAASIAAEDDEEAVGGTPRPLPLVERVDAADFLLAETLSVMRGFFPSSSFSAFAVGFGRFGMV